MLVKNKQGKIIGEVIPQDFLFKKSVNLSRHLMKKIDAFGIDAAYFTNVLLPNNYHIKITERDEHKIYRITAVEFKKNAEYLHFNKDQDHGAQIFLARRFWQVESY